MHNSATQHTALSFSHARPLFLASLVAVTCGLCNTATPTLAATEFPGQLKSVTITDAAGTNTPPTAVIEYTNDGDTYTFDASKSTDPDGTIVSYKWDFGDGTKGEGANVTHQFTGNVTPTNLTIVDNKGGLAIAQTTVAVELIIDNGEPGFTTMGTWSNSTHTKGYFGPDYTTTPPSAALASATWSFSLPVSGNYELFCQYTSLSNRATDATYVITNSGKTVGETAVNQRVNGGVFVSLGKFYLNKGTLEIKLSSTPTGYVIADAIKVFPH